MEEIEKKEGGFDGFLCKCGKRSTFKDQKRLDSMNIDHLKGDYSKTWPHDMYCGHCQAYLCTLMVLEKEDEILSNLENEPKDHPSAAGGN